MKIDWFKVLTVLIVLSAVTVAVWGKLDGSLNWFGFVIILLIFADSAAKVMKK